MCTRCHFFIKGKQNRHIPVLREFKGKAGVLLELGSIGSEATRELINTKASEIGKEIATGIYKYLFNTTPRTKAERAREERMNKILMKMYKENIMQQDNTRVVKPIYFIPNEKHNN